MLNTFASSAYDRSKLSEQWGPTFFGPIYVLERSGPVTCRMELPSSKKRAHNIFHVSKLKLFKSNGQKEY